VGLFSSQNEYFCFQNNLKTKVLLFAAPKLYHNFAARVKNFFVGVFPYVVFMQPGTILAPRP